MSNDSSPSDEAIVFIFGEQPQIFWNCVSFFFFFLLRSTDFIELYNVENFLNLSLSQLAI